MSTKNVNQQDVFLKIATIYSSKESALKRDTSSLAIPKIGYTGWFLNEQKNPEEVVFVRASKEEAPRWLRVINYREMIKRIRSSNIAYYAGHSIELQGIISRKRRSRRGETSLFFHF